MTEMQSAEVTAAIAANRALAARLQIKSTPQFVIGDEVHRGTIELERLRILVARAHPG